MEAALRESEARRGAALAIANLGTFDWDVRTNAVTLDDRSREIFGFAPGEGTRAEEVFARIAPADFPRVLAEAQASQRELTRFETEYRINLPDGTVRIVISINDAIIGLDGKAERMFGVFGDITARKQSEEALRRGAAQFRQLADAMPQMVWVTRPDGYHEYFNQRWYEFTGVPEGSTDGEGWNAMFHPDEQERARSVWRHSLATGEPYEIEYRLRHHSGEYRWTLGRALPVRDEQGNIERWFGTCTDIHAIKQLMDERESLLQREQSARAEAETANRAKDQFLAVLSHELRTPLTPVALTAVAMEMDPALPLEFRDDVAMIRRNVELETRLIDDLLDLSRITSGKLRLNRQPTHVHEIIRHVLQTVGAELHEKQLRVEQELTAAHDRVDADPARLQQTLWNLLKNAGKFTPSGGRVVVRTRNADDRVIIEVADTGKGIARQALPHVFDPFEQGDAGVTRQYGGMGLGLAIAKAVVDLHGGAITAASDGVGQGAVFTVAFPLGKYIAPAGPACAGDFASGQDRPVRLLLVEDHADSAKILVRLLRQEGTEVQWAGTVAAALELAASEPFDVVVSDLGLPDGTGYHLMRELLRQRSIVGIAMSGYGMEDDLRQSREAGFVEHLVKPVNLPELREAIRRAATKKHDRRSSMPDPGGAAAFVGRCALAAVRRRRADSDRS